MRIFIKINIKKIVEEHLKTLVNHNTKKPDLDDYLTFLILPILIATGLTYFGIHLTDQATNIVITTLSIFVGLLFNVIVIIFDIVRRENDKINDSTNSSNQSILPRVNSSMANLKRTFLRQILVNISYSIILSLVIISATLLTYIEMPLINCIFSWIVFFLIGHFLTTLLMILKRVYVLFITEFDDQSEPLNGN